MAAKQVSAGTVNRLQDEVYSHMFRLEARRPFAELQLALALLYAWNALELQAADSEPRRWLRTICPLCIGMIAEILTANIGCSIPPVVQEDVPSTAAPEPPRNE